MESRLVTLVLCLPDGRVLGTTPEFVVPVPWWQEVGPVVEAAGAELGVDVRILRLLIGPEWYGPPAGGPVTYLAEIDSAPSLSLATWTGPDPVADHPLRQTWARPGGPAADLDWAMETLQARGLASIGPARQRRSWNLSSIWELPTDGGPVWLKVVPSFFAHEPALLARLAGEAVPPLLGRESGRMLLADVPGEDQYEAPRQAQIEMIRLLVDLQSRWAGRVDELLAIGVADLRGSELTRRIRGVVARCAGQLTAGERSVIADLVTGLPARFHAVAACGLPDTLVHGDFHPGNVRGPAGVSDRDSSGDGAGLVILDWGDSGVGNPMLDQLAFGRLLDPDDRAAAEAEWVRLWQRSVPGSDPSGAAELLRPLTPLYGAAVYQRFLDTIEPDEYRYHAGDPVASLREAVDAVT